MNKRPAPRETAQRSFVKSLIFRVAVIISDTTVIFLLTHKAELTVGLTIVTNLASMTLYYLYERAWSRISWGRL